MLDAAVAPVYLDPAALALLVRNDCDCHIRFAVLARHCFLLLPVGWHNLVRGVLRSAISTILSIPSKYVLSIVLAILFRFVYRLLLAAAFYLEHNSHLEYDSTLGRIAQKTLVSIQSHFVVLWPIERHRGTY